MSKLDFISQLEKEYGNFLKNRIQKNPFKSFFLRGGKTKPKTSHDLYGGIQQFLKFEKNENKKGWIIEWEEWSSKKVGKQKWPNKITVETQDDYIFLIQKENEISAFDKCLAILTAWKKEIVPWLIEHPFTILKYVDKWQGILAVADFLLLNDASLFYIRNLPVPVHTKFIEENENIILSILAHLDPVKFPSIQMSFDEAVGTKKKPILFPVRWLDETLARQYCHGMEILGITPESLSLQNWDVKEVWFVENETALYMLPKRERALAIWSRGKALELLSNIPLFNRTTLNYWGDIDEEGFGMLSQCRRLYPHTTSVLMDPSTVDYHVSQISKQPALYKHQSFDLLNSAEQTALEKLYECNGRLEQESLSHEFIISKIVPL